MPEEAAAMQAAQTVTLSTQELQEPKRKDDQKGSEDGSQLVRALGFFVTRQAKTIDYNHSGSCWTKKWVSDEQGSIERHWKGNLAGIKHCEQIVQKKWNI